MPRVLLPLLVVIGALSAAPARAVCVFDPAFFSLENYQETPFVDWVVWRAEDKTAGIVMRNGDAISVQHWACEELGLSATMIVRPAVKTPEAQQKKLMELADVVLQKPQRDDLAANLLATAWSPDTVHDIAGPITRPEFSYAYRQMGDYDLVELRYAYN